MLYLDDSECGMKGAFSDAAINFADQFLAEVDGDFWKDKKKVDGQLLKDIFFIINVYQISLNNKYLNYAISILEKCRQLLDENSSADLYLSLATLFAKLFQITKREQFINSAFDLITDINIPKKDECSYEGLIMDKLTILIQLLSITPREYLLFEINLSIRLLLSRGCFESSGVYWPSLYRVDKDSRIINEHKLRMVFYKLSCAFKNDAFLDIARNVKASQTFKKKQIRTGEDRHKKSLIECVMIDTNLQLDTIFLATGSIAYSDIAIITDKVLRKVTRNSTASDLYLSKSLILGIIFEKAYEITSCNSYLKLSQEKFLYALNDINIPLAYILKREIALSSLILNSLYIHEAHTEPFSLHSSNSITADIISSYPCITFSPTEIRGLLFSNIFPKTMLLLRDIIPSKLNRFLRRDYNRKNEIRAFLNFVTEELNLNSKLKKYLKPIIKLESTEYRMFNKCKMKATGLDRHIPLKNKLLNITDETFSTLILMVSENIKVTSIILNPEIKTYGFTIGLYLLNTHKNLILIRYNRFTHLIEELPIDQLDLIILKALKKDGCVKNASKDILSHIEYEIEQLEDAQNLVNKRIRFLIDDNILIENQS